MNLREALMAKRLNVMRTRYVRACQRQALVPLATCNCPACTAMRANGGNPIDALFRALGGTPADVEEPPAGGKAH